MPVYYYILFVALLMIMLVLIRHYLLRTNSIPVQLFAKGLENENSGYYQAAVASYETALSEVKKKKYHNNQLESRIVSKLKVLKTMIEYESSFQLKR
jgi:hypothetical protein